MTKKIQAPGCFGCISDQGDMACLNHGPKSLSKETLPCGKKTHAAYCRWCSKVIDEKDRVQGDVNRFYYHVECKKTEDEYREQYK